MKALAMILVIMGHINYANDEVKEWIYSFHMPAFFFCSGLVLTNNKRKKLSFGQVITKRFKRLMIPYLLWALFYAKFTIPNFCMIMYGSHQTLISSGSLSYLWFLPVMFVALLIFLSLEKLKCFYSNWFKMILTLIAIMIAAYLPHIKIGYLWGGNVAFMAFAFIMIGNMSKKMTNKVYSYLLSKHHFIGLAICLAVVLLMGLGTMAYPCIQPDKGWVLMANARYGNIFLFLLVALCGTIMLLALSLLIDLCHPRNISWLSFVGQNTLIFFAIQKPIISCFRVICRYIQMSETIELIGTTFFTLVISVLLCLFINKYAPMLAGKDSSIR